MQAFAAKAKATKGNIYTARTKDEFGRAVYYVLQVPSSKEAAFMKAMQGTKMVDYSEYGEMLAYDFGHEPDFATTQRLKAEYGYTVPA